MKKIADPSRKRTTGSPRRDKTNEHNGQNMSHLTSTIEHPNWMTIDTVVFNIHVDSALHTMPFRHAWLPRLDTAPQTMAVQRVYEMCSIIVKSSMLS